MADPLVPDEHSLDALREAAAGCRACDLWANATQTVFGEGDEYDRFMLVGEQPGDQEDLSGEPFVGPAGKLLDRALAAAGIERDSVYVTNAVKHFKWTPRGKRRLHQKPNGTEVAAEQGRDRRRRGHPGQRAARGMGVTKHPSMVPGPPSEIHPTRRQPPGGTVSNEGPPHSGRR